VKGLKNQSDTILSCALIGMLLLLIFPLNAFFLDAFLAINLLLSLITLFLTLSMTSAGEFSTFPSLLLFLTLFRLGLNIASTRLILSKGQGGSIITTFGEFVTAGNLLIGFVLFALLTIINFIVITKGAGRIAEVAARFTLEALPGKQMALDAELQGGALNALEAREERAKIAAESEFYGAMDGASKFVRGDAIAGIIITLVNLLGGLAIALTSQKSPSLYLNLAIGDGLVTQIPALMVSLSGALIVSRARSGSLAQAMLHELFGRKKVLLLAGIALLVFSLVPGMPKMVLLTLLLPLFLYSLSKKREPKEPEPREENLLPPAIEVILGIKSLHLADHLLREVAPLREKMAKHLGINLPSIHIRDDLTLPPEVTLIKIKGVTAFSMEVKNVDDLICILHEKIIDSAHELISRQDVALMVEWVKKSDPVLVDELLPGKITLGELLKVLQNLLREGFPIRDFATILETIAAHMPKEGSFDPHIITELLRQKLIKQMLEGFVGREKGIGAITLDPKVELMLGASMKKTPYGTHLALRPATLEKMEKELEILLEKAKEDHLKMVVLTGTAIRGSLGRLLEKHQTKVLSYEEVDSVEVKFLGSITNEVLI
jgi:flagellar biosynthesis protein FlhA